jgi:acetyl-CoA acetyltransferase family protein
MSFENTYIPYGAYWSTPFARWQGSLGSIHSMKLAAESAKSFFEARKIPPESLDALVLGITVHQRRSFYGAPWLAGLIGAPDITGATVSQACATSVRSLFAAALEVETGARKSVLAVCCDRTSNGPHVYYPDPKGVGGRGEAEEPVWDNFNLDPWARNAMIDTAENVAKEQNISREEQDQITLLRHEQYRDALADDGAFQKRFMIPVALRKGRKVVGSLDADEGIFPTTAEGLAGLRTVQDGGSVTFGTQTYPADGNAGLMVTNRAMAAELGQGGPTIQVLGFGEARVEKGFMPKAVVPAAMTALERAGLSIDEVQVAKTHNPFAVNDVYFSRQTGLAPEKVNRCGSSLIYGHPQAPTGLRSIIEMLELLAMDGGGIGLFSGCAAGDTAMAMAVRVEV